MSGLTRHESAWRRRAWLVLYRSASDVAAKSVMFVITVVAARRLPVEQFALFALASTLGWLGAVAADFGVQIHLARAVAQYPPDAAVLVRRWLPVRLATGALSLMVALAASHAMSPGTATLVPMVVLIVVYAATGLSECVYYVFRGLDRSDLESSLTLVHRAALGILALGVLTVHPDITTLAVAMVLPAVGMAAAATVLVTRLTSAQGQPLEWPTPGTRREFWTAVAPIGVGILLSALYFRIDVVLLQRWAGARDVGLYNAVFRLVDALRLFPAAVLAVALPSLFRARTLHPLRAMAPALTAAAAGAALGLWLTAPWLVPAVYGPAFVDAVTPFRVLVLALPLMSLNYALTHQLIGWHGHRAYAVICGAALAGNLLLNWRLIPAAGMAGAAWSTVWTEVLLTAGCVLALARLSTAAAVREAGADAFSLEVHP